MLVPLRDILQLSDSFRNERVLLRNMLFTDISEIAKYKSDITIEKGNIGYAVNTIEKTVTPEVANQFKDLKNAYDAYSPIIETAIQKIESGNKQTVIEDLKSVGELYVAENNLANAINKLSYAAKSLAEKKNGENQDQAKAVQNLTYGIIGAVLLFSLLIGIFTARGISRPVKKLTNAIKMLAAGNTDIPSTGINSKDEIGQMRNAFRSIIDSVKKLEEDTNILIEGAKEGRLSVRADAEQHQGAYRKIIEGFNHTLDAVTQPVNEAANVLGEVSKGNLDLHVTGDFKGDYAIIKNSLNETIDTLNELVKDTNTLIEAAVDGRLSERAESEKHFGAYRKIIEGFNATLDAIILPVKRGGKSASGNFKRQLKRFRSKGISRATMQL